jgi:hypothetical protein
MPNEREFAAGPVAQWLEPAAHNGLVAGSSPAGPTTSMIRQRSQTSVVIRRSDIFLILQIYPGVQAFADVRVLFANIPSFCWHICWYLIDAKSEIPTCH